MTIKTRLSNIREERGLSIRAIAEATGLAYNTVKMFDKNQSDRYDKGTIARLCDYLNVTPGDLLVLDSHVEDTGAEFISRN